MLEPIEKLNAKVTRNEWLHPRALKEYENEIAELLRKLFNLSLKSAAILEASKCVCVLTSLV